MAAPAFVQASSGSTDATGAWSHTTFAANAAGNVYIVQLLQDGTSASAPTISSVTNAENLAGTDNVLTFVGSFDCGSAVAAKQLIWMGRALSLSAMVITGANVGGDDVYVHVCEFKNVNTGTTIGAVIENGSAGATVNNAGTGTTIVDTDVTTLGADRLVLNLLAIGDDLLPADITGASGTWTLRANYLSASGTDGSVNMFDMPAPTAGTYGGGSTTISSGAWGMLGFALIGTTAAGPAASLLWQPAPPPRLYGR